MPTSNVTWTNNSTASNPAADDTTIERTEQIAFSHINAMPSSIDSWQGSTAAGLDPSIASGSYADTGVTADTHVGYRITTSRSPGGVQEDVTSIPSGMEYIQDSPNELGYPNGNPVTASNYNCNVEPQLHLDTSRVAGYEQGEEITGSLASMIRHDKNSTFGIDYVGTAPAKMGQVYNATSGAYHRTLESRGSAGNTTISFRQTLGNPDLEYADGVTLFRAAYQDASGYIYGDHAVWNAGYNLISSSTGIRYDYGIMSLKETTWGITSTCWWKPPSGSLTNPAPFWAIYAIRVNNDAAQFATGTIKGQMFKDGADNILTSGNVQAQSYHNTGVGLKGAWGTPDNVALNVLNAGSSEQYHFGELLLFDTALDLGDMNEVFGYLCNKYDNAFTPISSGDLVG
jgi:hypothetical protein